MIRDCFHLILLFNFPFFQSLILANERVRFNEHFPFRKDGPTVIAGYFNFRQGFISA